MIPFPLPRRTPGFVFNGGKSNAPIHLSAFLDLTCADSKRVWPVIKKLANNYGPKKIRLTVHFFALAYFNNAFRALKVTSDSVEVFQSYDFRNPFAIALFKSTLFEISGNLATVISPDF